MAFEIKQPKKREKEESIFSIESDEKQKINEINEDLYSAQSPIQIKNKYTLLVESNGQKHEITRKDISEYQRKYQLEGQEGHDITGFRSLGSIHGNYEMLDKIYGDVNNVFGRLDGETSYKTVPSED